MKTTFAVIQVRIEQKRSYVLFRVNPEQPTLVPFIYQIHFLKSRSKETVRKKLLAIKNIYEYFNTNHKLDVDELLINKKEETLSKYLQDFCIQTIYKNGNIGYHYKKSILSHIADFLYWAIKRYSKSDEIANRIKDQIFYFVRYVNYPSKNSKDFLSQEDVKQFLKFSNPDSIENPFKSHVKLRNHLMIKILIFTGLRISELLKIKSVDVVEQNNKSYYLEVVNREDELDDIRSDEPSLKNKQSERVVSITKEIYEGIQIYISDYRRPIRNGKPIKLKNGYLFLSERGHPLSKTVIYDLLRNLKNSILKSGYKLEKNISPHSFRHYFSCSFLENLIEVQGIDEERAKDQLRVIGGWSLNSKMPEFYARNYISRSANEYNINRIENSYAKVRENKL